MPENNKVALGLWTYTFIAIIFALYYYYPVYSGTYKYMDSIFSFTLIGLLFWIDILLIIFLIFSATYGFYYRKKWSRIFVIFFLLYNSFWAIMSIFVMRFQVFEHFIYFTMNIVFLVYFNLSFVFDYFNNTIKKKQKPFFAFKGYILHKKEIKTKFGKIRDFYFFSKTVRTTGVPCKKPEDFIVKINKRTGIPYLKKKEQ